MLFRGVLIVVLAAAVGAVIVSRLDVGGDDSSSGGVAEPTGPTPPFQGGAVPPGIHEFPQFDVPLSMVFGDGWTAPFAPDDENIVLEGPVFLAISRPSMVVDPDSGKFVSMPNDLIAWVGTHKNFEATAPVEMTLGGRPAFMIDATALEGTKTLAFKDVDAILVAKGDRMRLIVADVDGKTVTALIIASPAEFDAKVAAGQALLDTLRFEARRVMGLQGRVAIVTGAGSGIGRAIALGFAAEGASVVVSDINGKAAEAVVSQIGGAAMPVLCDVSDTAQVNGMVEAAVKRFGRVDILVNNAGRARGNVVARMTDEDWDTVFATNVRGTFLCSRAVLHHMIPQKSGVIVNTASGLGMRSLAGAAAYGASKAAVIHFTKTLALEVARHGVRVNAFTPGVTDTPLWRAFRTEEDIAEAFRTGRVGQPDDLVPAVLFLCSTPLGTSPGWSSTAKFM